MFVFAISASSPVEAQLHAERKEKEECKSQLEKTQEVLKHAQTLLGDAVIKESLSRQKVRLHIHMLDLHLRILQWKFARMLIQLSGFLDAINFGSARFEPFCIVCWTFDRVIRAQKTRQ